MANSVTGGSSVRRLLVGIRKLENNDTIKLAKFVDCVVKYFSPNKLSVNVGCKLEDDVLILYETKEQETLSDTIHFFSGEKVKPKNISDFGTVVLQHSPSCPFMMLEEDGEITAAAPIPDTTLKQGVYVGVAVILESSDSHVLLTQRSSHMRSFPGAWVPPGGNIENGEGLMEGGLRELLEETGLGIQPTAIRILCLWESVFPSFLFVGLPRYHHIVVYIHFIVPKTWLQLQDDIKLDPEEVQACTWLNVEDVRSLVMDTDEDRSVLHWRVSSDTENTSSTWSSLSSMFRAPWVAEPLTGVQAALHAWLQYKDNSCVSKL